MADAREADASADGAPHPLHTDALVRVFAWLDPLSLIAASAVCRQWGVAAGERSLWHQHLQDFFCGDLPPSMQSSPCEDPRAELAAQFAAALELKRWESKTEAFQFPAPTPSISQIKEWKSRLDSEIAAEQIKRGVSRASPNRPYYGTIGGAYSTATTVYGSWAKHVYRNSEAATLGINAPTLTHWVRLERGGPIQMASDYEYGRMKVWLDDALSELSQTGECKVHRRGKHEAAAKEDAHADLDIDRSVQLTVIDPTTRPAGALQVTAGAYGGLFKFIHCPMTIGHAYSLQCMGTGKSIEDFSNF